MACSNSRQIKKVFDINEVKDSPEPLGLVKGTAK
jgi:hypothetical protein